MKKEALKNKVSTWISNYKGEPKGEDFEEFLVNRFYDKIVEPGLWDGTDEELREVSRELGLNEDLFF